MMLRAVVIVLLAMLASASDAPALVFFGPTQSAPIALSRNEDFLVNVNPEGNTITIFTVDGDTLTVAGRVTVGTEPRSVAIHPNSRTAYVANARSANVSVVDLISRSVTNTVPAGAQPMAVALSPNGSRLYVANASSNNLMVFNTSTLNRVGTVPLQAYGTSPRALAVTNDGDTSDTDETVFVAMFFSQLRPGKTPAEEGQDDQREGRVVGISTATNAVTTGNPIRLGPLLDTGFSSNGRLLPASSGIPAVPPTNPETFSTPTGAFPNQLASIAIHPTSGRAYVVSTGASPNGPLRFDSNVHGLVSVFDTNTKLEVTAGQTGTSVRRMAPLNLNRGLDLATTPMPRLFLSNPTAIAWRPDGTDAWITAQNSDVLVRMTANGAGIPTINAPLATGPSTLVRLDLQNRPGAATGVEAPRGLVINRAGTRLFVGNFASRHVTAVDISTPTSPVIVGSVPSAALPAAGTLLETRHLGSRFFVTGRGRWSKDGWGSCVTCHPDGLSDNVTWMFPSGPRQTVPLDGTFTKAAPRDQRILNWSAIFDEIQDFELNVRNVSGGQGVIDDDRFFFAIGGANSTSASIASIVQINQFTGQVGGRNGFTGGVMPSLSGFGPRRDFAVATLDDTRVFIMGGRTGAGAGTLITGANTVLVFNPQLGTVERRSSLNFTPRHSLGATVVPTPDGPRIYAIGGYPSTSTSVFPTTAVQEYNPATDTWRSVQPLPTGVAQFGVTAAGGVSFFEPFPLIHVVSGNCGTEDTPALWPAIQRFTPSSSGMGSWAGFTPSGLTARRLHGAATVFRGPVATVFAIGGIGSSGVLGSVQSYGSEFPSSAMTNTPLPSPLADFGIASSLTTNQIYVVGGVNGAGTPQSTIFELSTEVNGPVAGPPGFPSGRWASYRPLGSARRGLQLSTAPGLRNLLPFATGGRSAELDAVRQWIKYDVRSAPAPFPASNAAVVRGRTVFSTSGCATCHGGPRWTRSTMDFPPPPSPDTGIGFGNEVVGSEELQQTATQDTVLHDVGTFTFMGRQNAIRSNPTDVSDMVAPLGIEGFNIPSLLGVHQTAPYFHNGMARSLSHVLGGQLDTNGGEQPHLVSEAARADLIRFLQSIDGATTPFD